MSNGKVRSSRSKIIQRQIRMQKMQKHRTSSKPQNHSRRNHLQKMRKSHIQRKEKEVGVCGYNLLFELQELFLIDWMIYNTATRRRSRDVRGKK